MLACNQAGMHRSTHPCSSAPSCVSMVQWLLRQASSRSAPQPLKCAALRDRWVQPWEPAARLARCFRLPRQEPTRRQSCPCRRWVLAAGQAGPCSMPAACACQRSTAPAGWDRRTSSPSQPAAWHQQQPTRPARLAMRQAWSRLLTGGQLRPPQGRQRLVQRAWRLQQGRPVQHWLIWSAQRRKLRGGGSGSMHRTTRTWGPRRSSCLARLDARQSQCRSSTAAAQQRLPKAGPRLKRRHQPRLAMAARLHSRSRRSGRPSCLPLQQARWALQPWAALCCGRPAAWRVRQLPASRCHPRHINRPSGCTQHLSQWRQSRRPHPQCNSSPSSQSRHSSSR